ncbi:MAG: Nif3-like dinuclear metal center hexameric protein [Candidatus Kapaibacterium sp.]|nr:Nif3-like dinuclear metal center hexameric protein [Ignavibacteria bacterium]WKZ78654.1 MAG: Nif3-like dinuclear metal center hexameric protein [Candidatus Kapabacteria bacterium]
MQVHSFLSTIESVLPLHVAVSGDPVGLQVENTRNNVLEVMVTLDVTNAVIAEAETLGVDTIVSYHPLVYSPLHRIALSDRTGRLVSKLIRADISLICVHTAFDVYPQGTNALLCGKLGLLPMRVLRAAPQENMGIVAQTRQPVPLMDFVHTVATVCGNPVRFSAGSRDHIHTVAMVGGSGFSYYGDAVAAGADVFITADVKYHSFMAAKDQIAIIDPGHFEMEQFVPHALTSELQSLCPHIRFHTSQIITNPVQYYSP